MTDLPILILSVSSNNPEKVLEMDLGLARNKKYTESSKPLKAPKALKKNKNSLLIDYKRTKTIEPN